LIVESPIYREIRPGFFVRPDSGNITGNNSCFGGASRTDRTRRELTEEQEDRIRNLEKGDWICAIKTSNIMSPDGKPLNINIRKEILSTSIKIRVSPPEELSRRHYRVSRG
jgi:hypothetical protein